MANPRPQFTHFVTALKDAHPELAYLHVVEPDEAYSGRREGEAPESNDFIRQIWSPRPLITAGGYTRNSALDRARKNENELIAFGKLYIANVCPPFLFLCMSLLTMDCSLIYQHAFTKTFRSLLMTSYSPPPKKSQATERVIQTIHLQTNLWKFGCRLVVAQGH